MNNARTRADTGLYCNREGWLTGLAKELEPVIRGATRLKPTAYRIACGWPSRRGTSDKHRLIGECWNGNGGGRPGEIFISPTIDEPLEVAETVAHELLHAFLPKGVGHRAPFSQAAKALGLMGKPTETYAGEQLKLVLVEMTTQLGPYPHERIAVVRAGEKGRNLKFSCGCGYIGRTSAFHLDNAGAPFCPTCRVQMVCDGAAPVVLMTVVSQLTEFMLPDQDRFVIMQSRTERLGHWYLLDFGAEGFAGGGQARHTAAESRQDALDMIEGLLSGQTTYEMLAIREDDLRDRSYDRFLDDEEDEVADYPEDQASDRPEDRRREALHLLRAGPA